MRGYGPGLTSISSATVSSTIGATCSATATPASIPVAVGAPAMTGAASVSVKNTGTNPARVGTGTPSGPLAPGDVWGENVDHVENWSVSSAAGTTLNIVVSQ